jgi:hypothetical protein
LFAVHPFMSRRVGHQRPVHRAADLLEQREIRFEPADQVDLGVQETGRPGIDVPAHHPNA